MMKLFIAYILVMNLIAYGAMAYDKSQARKHGRRVPERTLFILAAIGGSIGAISGMRIKRHKTKHPSFVIGMPVILIVQAVLVYRLV
ncbi:DUF1294 domain-containing protein [Cohnella endophytica]|uniref:DUF1294 domain-containing protein n=1 Tax=Cohnella endophytica TaxID=2419778 RepID=A0A494X0P9_9BACL|nr:DUF1294 domain-containing protein [Cohnella endophytica]